MILPPLSEWESFYVITGSSAAALTGLQFVVIALMADTQARGESTALRAFGTPTVVHFCAVLLLAGFMTTPGQSTGSLRACFLAEGIAGLAYVASVMRHTRRQTSYTPVFEDWLWHGILPAVAYLAILISAVVLRAAPNDALYTAEGTALLLLFTGIHNAWDSAVWMATSRSKPEAS